jgi:hypothetical protein
MHKGYLKYFGVLFCLIAIVAIIPTSSASCLGECLHNYAHPEWVYDTNGYAYNYSSFDALHPLNLYQTAGITDGTADAYCKAQLGVTASFSSYPQVWYSTNLTAINIVHTYPTMGINGFDYTYVAGQLLQDNTTAFAGKIITCNAATGDSVDGVSITSHALFISKIQTNSWSAAIPPALIANFTASFTDAVAPAYVPFTDTSENEYGTCTYNWSYSPTTGVLVAPGDLDNENIVMLFTENGNFSISHGVACGASSSIKTRSDYIHITNASGVSTFRVRAVDAISGYGINGATVDIFDIQNASWQNQTSVTGEVTASVVTGHHVNAYGFATGYSDNDVLDKLAINGDYWPIYMNPTTFNNNVSAGNVTLYVTLLEEGTNTRMAGYGVSLRKGHPTGGPDYTAGVTNANGVYQTTVTNKTDYWISVEAQKGHLGASKSFNSGTQSGGDSYIEETLWLGINSVTTGPTVTTLPGGGTPVPTITYLAHCNPSGADYDATKCQQSESNGMMDQLYEAGPSLIGLCIVAIIFGLLRMIMG